MWLYRFSDFYLSLELGAKKECHVFVVVVVVVCVSGQVGVSTCVCAAMCLHLCVCMQHPQQDSRCLLHLIALRQGLSLNQSKPPLLAKLAGQPPRIRLSPAQN